jgi:hypothetical protein
VRLVARQQIGDFHRQNATLEGVGRPELEPGTNPESFRGCSVKWWIATLKLRVADSFFVLERARVYVLRPLMRVPSPRQFDLASESMRRLIAATLMLCDSGFKVVGRPDVIPSSAVQDVNPSHTRAWAGRDSNPEPTP